MKYKVACTKCRHIEPDNASKCSRCNSILEVHFDYSTLSLGKNFRKQKIGQSKYIDFFPIDKFEIDGGSFGTPLKSMRYKSKEIMLKIETKNPTRSFKDRGSAVELSKAVELGFRDVCCASTGNMGISVARYSKLAGINATIFISKDANKKKIEIIKSHGARIIKVDGDFNKAIETAERFSKDNKSMLCGDYHYRKEGQKSIIFEVIEQLKYKTPDFIFMPVGSATLLSATYKGLREFRMLSMINKYPKLVASQSDMCNPLIKAYESSSRIKYVKPMTSADAIAVGYPIFGSQGLDALKKTRGMGVSVSEDEIRNAVIMLKRMGIGSEPGGAAGFAGFAKLYERNREIFDRKSVVIIITGNN